MKGLDIIGGVSALLFCLALTLFSAAWCTLLPALGLLWLIGWLP